jgi:hypothetical protein
MPYAITFQVRFTRFDWYPIPLAAAPYTAQHEETLTWTVRDRSHYRLDVNVAAPALDSGSVTFIRRGLQFLHYDSRTGTAIGWSIPARIAPLFNQSTGFVDDPGATAVGDPGSQTVGRGSVSRYVASIQSSLKSLGVHGSIRIAGYTHVARHPAAVLDVRPAQFDWSTCARKPAHTCYTGYGWRRLWIDQQHGFLLGDVQHGAVNAHDPHFDYGRFQAFATSVAYGAGPSDAQLAYVPPVAVRQLPPGSVLQGGFLTGGGGPSGAVALPKPFLDAPSPRSIAPVLSHSEGYSNEDERAVTVSGPSKGPAAEEILAEFLFSHGTHTTTYLRKRDRYGASQYVTGPYLLGQERVRTDGLPPALRTGTVHQIGSCQVWIGVFAGGQTWATFARGTVSVLLAGNALSQSSLLTYVHRAFCAWPPTIAAGHVRRRQHSAALPALPGNRAETPAAKQAPR